MSWGKVIKQMHQVISKRVLVINDVNHILNKSKSDFALI